MPSKKTPLYPFWRELSPEDKEDFARRCETTVGHLSNIAYGCKPCSESLAIDIERESSRKVRVEGLCPEVDWAYIRGSSRLKTNSVSAG